MPNFCTRVFVRTEDLFRKELMEATVPENGGLKEQQWGEDGKTRPCYEMICKITDMQNYRKYNLDQTFQ